MKRGKFILTVMVQLPSVRIRMSFSARIIGLPAIIFVISIDISSPLHIFIRRIHQFDRLNGYYPGIVPEGSHAFCYVHQNESQIQIHSRKDHSMFITALVQLLLVSICPPQIIVTNKKSLRHIHSARLESNLHSLGKILCLTYLLGQHITLYRPFCYSIFIFTSIIIEHGNISETVLPAILFRHSLSPELFSISVKHQSYLIRMILSVPDLDS